MSNFESHELWRRGFTPKSKPIKPPPSDQAMKDEVEKSHNFEDSYHHVLKSANERGVRKFVGFGRLIRDLFVLSMKTTLAMIIAAYRAIIPPSMKNLIGETVVITGAGHGIGRELAIQLASLGCIVICWDIDEQANRSTINAILQDGGEVYGYLVDVSNRLEVRETVRMMRRNGIPEVTILINNAAILMQRPFLEQNYEDVEKIFNVNVLSNFWTLEAFLPTMLQNGRGHVVSMCSMCGMYGVSQKVAYCSSKYAVRGLMDGIREEFRHHAAKPKIHFTTIYPFYVNTGLAEDPNYRFPYLFRAVTPKYAAEEVIRALRRNYSEYTIPKCLFPLNTVNRLLPESAMNGILDFLSDARRGRNGRYQLHELPQRHEES